MQAICVEVLKGASHFWRFGIEQYTYARPWRNTFRDYRAARNDMRPVLKLDAPAFGAPSSISLTFVSFNHTFSDRQKEEKK